MTKIKTALITALVILPIGVYAKDSSFEDYVIVQDELRERIDQAVDRAASFVGREPEVSRSPFFCSAIVNRRELHRLRNESRFLHHFFLDGLRRRVVNVGPSAEYEKGWNQHRKEQQIVFSHS